MIKSINQRVEMTKERLKVSMDQYIKDKLTDCYNQLFLMEYLINEIDLIDFSKQENLNLKLILFKIDNIMDINIKYSSKIGDETIENLSYLLKENLQNNEILIKSNGPNFIVVSHDFIGKPIDYIRNIQNKVKRAEMFITPITVSGACVSINEFDLNIESEILAKKIVAVGIERIEFARELGANSYIDSETIIERQFFGNLLIVNSDELTLSIMKKFFEDSKYKVITTTDGLEALKLAKDNKYDAIISDRYIKKIDGLTLKEYINESSINMNSMFLLTVQSKNLDIINKINHVSIDFAFEKPIILEELLGIIKRETEKKSCLMP